VDVRGVQLFELVAQKIAKIALSMSVVKGGDWYQKLTAAFSKWTFKPELMGFKMH
jgi:hypothetical protein